MCDHIIGLLYDYDNTCLLTVDLLKEHIKTGIEMSEYCRKEGFPEWGRVYSLADYCDMRRRTDINRFTYCPMCGEYIKWRDIREGKT